MQIVALEDKMSKIIDLCGAWRLTCNESPIGKIDLEGCVPGCVHTDLIKNKVINDIFYRDNSKTVQWIENCDFTYTKKFTVESLLGNAYLEFEGLDTYADIYLNGVKLDTKKEGAVAKIQTKKGRNRVVVEYVQSFWNVITTPVNVGSNALDASIKFVDIKQ
jgi:hypothetical protein